MNYKYKIIFGHPSESEVIDRMENQLNQWAAKGWRVVSSAMRSDDLWLVILETTEQVNEWIKIGTTTDERVIKLEGK